MGNSIEMTVPENQLLIDTNKLGEFLWWCAHLGIGPEKLLSIIEKVGNKSESVRAYILTTRNLPA